MVAGMSSADLRAIYERLFQDGVIVAKKDKRPQSMHPDMKAVTNLKVIRAMGSLRSKGCVRETFAWKHAYYYLINEGVAYLRDYLHLPPEILPAPLKSAPRPASSARVHAVKGLTSYVSKPEPGQESQETLMDRHIYRHKHVGEEKEHPERPPKNLRGSKQSDASTGQLGVQTFLKRVKDSCREDERWPQQGLLTEDRATRPSVKEVRRPGSSSRFYKEMPPRGPVKEVLPNFVKMGAVNSPESECVKKQEALIEEPTGDVTRGETSNLALEMHGEVGPEVEHAVTDQFGKLTQDVVTEEELHDVEAFGSVSDLDNDSATSPSIATDSFRDVVDYDAQIISELHVTSKTSFSAFFEAGPALKTTLLQEDQRSPADDPERNVERVGSDFLEGLSLS
ncbi:Plectin [Nibea albiflora]|uniref:Plectin n=1 Tax=Nibea albiflora TaxID=240163 RepID=A0ACB7ES30_NIBAL|nr:Plectin [Nibea albiflora]